MESKLKEESNLDIDYNPFIPGFVKIGKSTYQELQVNSINIDI